MVTGSQCGGNITLTCDTIFAIKAHQIKASFSTHTTRATSLGTGYAVGVVDSVALPTCDELYKSFATCAEDRKYFSGASGIKIADKEHPLS